MGKELTTMLEPFGLDPLENHGLCIYYLCIYLFIYLFLRNAGFISTFISSSVVCPSQMEKKVG